MCQGTGLTLGDLWKLLKVNQVNSGFKIILLEDISGYFHLCESRLQGWVYIPEVTAHTACPLVKFTIIVTHNCSLSELGLYIACYFKNAFSDVPRLFAE